MASISAVMATTYGYSATLLNGAAKEDLLEQITNIDPWDTPFVAQAPKVGCKHVYHQWLTDTLASTDLTGAIEGASWSAGNLNQSIPERQFNITMILRKDLGVSETERAVDSAGFKDHYAYEVQKATKELAIKLEKCIFQLSTSVTGSITAARVMKGIQEFITGGGNTAIAGAAGAQPGNGTTVDGQLDISDFNNMLNKIYSAGGSPEQVYVSPMVKRQVSSFAPAGATQYRNIAAIEKKLVSSIDFYDSDFGLIQVVLDRWVGESINVAGQTATANSTATGTVGGKMFFLSRAINRLAWLRPMAHQLIGKLGDSVGGYVVGEVTLEVLSNKANGMIKSVNNRLGTVV
jgi:hypothetical protein